MIHIPGGVLFIVLFAVPTFASFYFSLTRWTLFDTEFIGLENYKLFFTEPGVGDFQCSASIIKNRVIVTAAHCVFDPVAKSFFTNWVFIPAFDGGLSNPAGWQTSPQMPFGAWAARFVTVSATWSNTGGALPNNGDFGLIVLQDQSFAGAAPVSVKTKVGASFTASIALSRERSRTSSK